MLFTGHAEVVIDAKQRLGIPAKYRALWDEKRDGKAWYCLPWTGGVIRLYSETQFVALAADFAKRMDESITTDGDEAELESILFGMVERVEPDASGRIVVPWKHIEFTRVCGVSEKGEPLTSGEVVVIGTRNRLELRNLSQWKQEEQERFAKLPTLIAKTEKARSTPHN